MASTGRDGRQARREEAAKRRTVPWRGAATVAGFALFPLLGFLADNRHEGIGFGAIAPYAALLVVPSILLVGLAWAVFGVKVAERFAVSMAAVLFVTTSYSAIEVVLGGADLRIRYQLLVWVVLLFAVVVVVWRFSRHQTMRDWFVLAAVLLVAVPTVQLTWYRLTASAPPVDTEAAVEGLERTPDIYFVLPDAYARADVLESVVGMDNARFLGALESRGFVVAPHAYANYPTTFLSVASILEMNYVVEPGPEALELRGDGRAFDRSVFYDIIRGGSVLVDTLREAGYRHVQAPPGTWSGSACSGFEDLCVEPVSESGAGVLLGELEWALLQLTPAAALLANIGETFDDTSSDPVHTVREIERRGYEQPVFAFVHMLHTHPPYRFDARCGRIDAGGRDLEGWGADTTDAYVAAIHCANRRLEAMIDALPADAVVVIQADHGTNFLGGASGSIDAWTERQVEERLAVFSALRLPPDCREMIDDDLAGVNTFRVVLACLSGGEPDLLPNRYMLAKYRGHGAVKEIRLPFTGN